jgi:hypothetical protein
VNVLLLDQYSDLGGAQQVLLELLPAIGTRSRRAVAGDLLTYWRVLPVYFRILSLAVRP